MPNVEKPVDNFVVVTETPLGEEVEVEDESDQPLHFEIQANGMPKPQPGYTLRRTLFDITNDMLAFNDMLVETGGDISDPSVEKALAEIFRFDDEMFHRKVGNYASLIRENQARALGIDDEIKRLTKLKNSYHNTAEGMKKALQFNMERLGLEKMEVENFKIHLQLNGGVDPVEIDRRYTLDTLKPELKEKYAKKTFSWDNNAIRAAIKAGVQLEFARLKERGKHPRIR